jgi:hypothetical protein
MELHEVKKTAASEAKTAYLYAIVPPYTVDQNRFAQYAFKPHFLKALGCEIAFVRIVQTWAAAIHSGGVSGLHI